MKKLLLLFLFFSIVIFSQDNSVMGKVTDEEGNPLEDVNVVIVGLNIGASTNSEGLFRIDGLQSEEVTLQFSRIGYRTEVKTFKAETEKFYTIVLHQEAVETGQVVITAGKYEQILSELPVSAEIIGGEVFHKKDFTNIRDALKYAGGVAMVDDQISIRGSSGYSRGAGTRVLVALDGIPLYTGDTGEIIWELIPVTEIERVEIIKGAASSLYGSSAAGGVINIITKNISEEPLTYLKMQGGFYDKPAHDEWDWSGERRPFNAQTITHSNTFGSFGLSLSLTRLNDASYRANNGFNRLIGYLKANYKIDNSSSLTLLANGLSQKTGYFIYWKDAPNALIPPDGDRNRNVESDRYMGGLIYNNVLSGRSLFNFKVSYYNTEWRDQSVSLNKAQAEIVRGETQYNFNAADNLLLITGVELSTAKVTSNIFRDPSAQSIGAFTQGDYRFNFPLLVSAGVRYDYTKIDSVKGAGAVSPKLGMNYSLSDKLILRSSSGFGFRVPSLAEAYTSTVASGIEVRENLSIKPERNITVELGINYSPFNNFRFDAAIFQNEFYDFIEPRLTAGNYVIFDNVTRARIQGAEINSSLALLDESLNLNLSYTYLHSRDLQENKVLKYRPRHQANFGASYNFLSAEVGADFRYWSKVEQMDFELVDLDIIKDGRKRAAAYILDFYAGYNLSGLGLPVRAFFNAKNILNYNYVELIANIAPIRNYSLSLELFF